MEEERLYNLYSIDEDIKILKEFINYKDKSNSHFQLIAISHERLCESIEHLIEAYKELEENIRLNYIKKFNMKEYQQSKKYKDYQHKYYLEVTKEKRKLKKLGGLI